MHKLLWKPLLAATLPVDYDLNKLPYPLLASPKIDGVRAMVQNGVLVSRNGRPINNLTAQLKFGHNMYANLDGELTIGKPNAPDVFNRTGGVCNSRDGDARLLRFNVFDMYGADTYSVRNRMLLNTFKNKGLSIVKQTAIKDSAALLKFEAKCLAEGYEGIMLRGAHGGGYIQKPCKDNRSTLNEFYLVKFKRWDFSEATILRIFPLEHNLNTERTATGARSSKKFGKVKDKDGRIGSATLRDCTSGVEFNVTIGSHELQTWQGWNTTDWLRIKVRYKFQPVGTQSAPRFPTCEFKELLS